MRRLAHQLQANGLVYVPNNVAASLGPKNCEVLRAILATATPEALAKFLEGAVSIEGARELLKLSPLELKTVAGGDSSGLNEYQRQTIEREADPLRPVTTSKAQSMLRLQISFADQEHRRLRYTASPRPIDSLGVVFRGFEPAKEIGTNGR